MPLVRYATTTPWGERLYLVPEKPVLETGSNGETKLRPETLQLFDSRGVWIIDAIPATLIEAGQADSAAAAGRRLYGGGASQVRFIYIVPDGVAKVTFVLPRDPLPGFPFEPVYAHTLSVSVPVYHNIVAVQIDRQFDRPDPPMIWYAANGTVIKRIGDFRDLNRVVPEPLPGPETPLSRAAEKDPSTPNPVWVTPAIGSARTGFTFHFHVLLNEASYTTRLSGPPCPGHHLYGTNPGEAPQADNLRGHIYNSKIYIDWPTTTWCPGVHHLSVTPISGAFDGSFKPPAKPFGTGTFTVRP